MRSLIYSKNINQESSLIESFIHSFKTNIQREIFRTVSAFFPGGNEVVKVFVAQPRPTLCTTWLARLLTSWNSPGKNSGVVRKCQLKKKNHYSEM